MRGLLCALAICAAAAAPARAADEVTPDHIRGLGSASRVVVVAASSLHTTRATARTYERTGSGWRRIRGAMPARLGYAGLRSAARRHEGDRTTPIGVYRFVYGLGSTPGPRGTPLAWRHPRPRACWAGPRA